LPDAEIIKWLGLHGIYPWVAPVVLGGGWGEDPLDLGMPERILCQCGFCRHVESGDGSSGDGSTQV
jgi:hypothetical protein